MFILCVTCLILDIFFYIILSHTICISFLFQFQHECQSAFLAGRRLVQAATKARHKNPKQELVAQTCCHRTESELARRLNESAAISRRLPRRGYSESGYALRHRH